LRHMIAGVRRFVATVDGAVNAVITVDRRTALTRTIHAGLQAITMEAVITVSTQQTLHTSVGVFIAKLGWTTRIGPIGAAVGRMACFKAVAIETIVASRALRNVVACIGGLVA